MRVIVSGAGGTGVREIAREVSRLFGFQVIESPVRELFEAAGITHEDQQANTPLDRMQAIERRIFDKAEEDIATAQNAVQVHSVLDHLAYRLVRSRAGMTDAELRDLEHRVVNSLASADLVVFCPHGVVGVDDDGVRSASDVDRTTVDAIIRGYIRRFGGKVTVLDIVVPSFRGRVQHVAASLSQLGADASHDGKRALFNAKAAAEPTIEVRDGGKVVLTTATFKYPLPDTERQGLYLPTRVFLVPNRAEAPAQLVYDEAAGLIPEDCEVFPSEGRIELKDLRLAPGLAEQAAEGTPFVVQVELLRVREAGFPPPTASDADEGSAPN